MLLTNATVVWDPPQGKIIKIKKKGKSLLFYQSLLKKIRVNQAPIAQVMQQITTPAEESAPKIHNRLQSIVCKNLAVIFLLCRASEE